ncbi:vacuolar protein sorting-associated protein 45-like isoform X3 [Gordionus sp. m RMFG-2023]|uniref:vacuolar protein sorting-associated protein 45-like isoform X3 n=1 Tax=Gordionus sp. m RMFG-2023 TaxID=3053472 RepID=UPI0031FBF359
MNLFMAIKNYIERMIQEAGPGMKLLLMDAETTSIVSMIFAQSEIFQSEVYLFEDINSSIRETIKYVKCITYLRPTNKNIQLLGEELKYPKYGAYYIYFTNVIMRSDLKTIAESDEYETVKEIKEFYGDFMAINSFAFTLNIKQIYQNFGWDPLALQRSVEGITSIFLSLKRKPIIRYQSNSDMTLKLAENVQKCISRDHELFNFRQNESSLLLLIDRRDDPVTPLLHQWTYQAMVHDLIGIYNNRVNLKTAPGVPKNLKEIVLSAEHDGFYSQNMYLNFGEISQNIKILMEHFQKKSQCQQKVESISDMKAFIENYPHFKKLSGKISKHVTLLTELSRLISNFEILKLSEIEQSLACGSTDHLKDLQEIKNALNNDKIKEVDLLKLVLLYALCYERLPNNDITGLIKILRKHGFIEKYIKMVHSIVDFGGCSFRNNDLFGTQDPIAYTKKIFKGMKAQIN